jgi:hypothetical protein
MGKKTNKKSIQVNDIMDNVKYRNDCFGIINDALKNGFDVLQLENGDIITTGTKVVSNHYTWDSTKKTMVEVKE